MAPELSARTRRRLSAALASWPHWDVALAAAPEAAAQLGGHSNTSLLLHGRLRDGRPTQLVLRLNGDNAHLGVDRDVERRVLQRIRDQPFAVPVLYLEPRLRFLVTRYVARQSPPPTPEGERLHQLGACLAQVHGLSGDGLPLRDCSTQIEHYRVQLRSRSGAAPPALDACVHRLTALPRTVHPTVLCHGDPQPDNLLWPGVAPRLLDWEYAGRAAPLFDLAVAAETAALDAAATAALLAGYGRSDAPFATALEHERLRYALVDLLWWLLRDPTSTPAAERAGALLRRIETADRNAGAPRRS